MDQDTITEALIQRCVCSPGREQAGPKTAPGKGKDSYRPPASLPVRVPPSEGQRGCWNREACDGTGLVRDRIRKDKIPEGPDFAAPERDPNPFPRVWGISPGGDSGPLQGTVPGRRRTDGRTPLDSESWHIHESPSGSATLWRHSRRPWERSGCRQESRWRRGWK